ncbi:uncharacterized protein LOC132204454 [Neocloeon triangulifer]|uniref:uncharacterized protein LOC132204454 n=1 Tax=Neocloeon triangulifer TaxID=2078957 RepID=UPI00286F9758|nr:uncharacterized protein LOC132204454 [Neocloeon triangulifer]
MDINEAAKNSTSVSGQSQAELFYIGIPLLGLLAAISIVFVVVYLMRKRHQSTGDTELGPLTGGSPGPCSPLPLAPKPAASSQTQPSKANNSSDDAKSNVKEKATREIKNALMATQGDSCFNESFDQADYFYDALDGPDLSKDMIGYNLQKKFKDVVFMKQKKDVMVAGVREVLLWCRVCEVLKNYSDFCQLCKNAKVVFVLKCPHFTRVCLSCLCDQPSCPKDACTWDHESVKIMKDQASM